MDSKKRVKQLITSEVKQSREYKRLNRPFRNYKDYANYSDVAVQIAAQLYTIPSAIALGKPLDTTWTATTHSFFGAYNSPTFSVYALEKDLLQAFLDSEPPSHLWGINKMFERALILFPKGMIKNPDGLNVEWILIDFLQPHEDENLKDYSEYIDEKIGRKIKHNIVNYEGIESYRIRWCSSIGLEYIYSSTTEIPKPGSNSSYPGFTSFIVGNPDDEKTFTRLITGLVFQTLLYMLRSRSQQDIKEQNGDDNLNTKRQKRVDPKTPKNYIVIGRDYTTRKPYQGGTHASPDFHVRRGHYRVLPWREIGNQEIWVRPCFVNNKDATQ